MHKIPRFTTEIFKIRTEEEFNRSALELCSLHYHHNPIYRQFVDYTRPDFSVGKLRHFSEIPFLPIELFKTQKILLDKVEPIDYFSSSGTTTTVNSKHYIVDFKLYERSFNLAFDHFIGPPEDMVILALLPNYLEQQHSSLVYMVDHLIRRSKFKESGFYLYNIEDLYHTLQRLEAKGQRTLVFGVSFALLDLAEQFSLPLRHTMILETGGMKGRRKEITREELHQRLQESFQTDFIYSEYGMCELLSQAYLRKNQRFACPPWMRILIRDSHDPLQLHPNPLHSGGINVIDLANVYTCPFIATQDLGKLHPEGDFEVLGRFDNSDLRGSWAF